MATTSEKFSLIAKDVEERLLSAQARIDAETTAFFTKEIAKIDEMVKLRDELHHRAASYTNYTDEQIFRHKTVLDGLAAERAVLADLYSLYQEPSQIKLDGEKICAMFDAIEQAFLQFERTLGVKRRQLETVGEYGNLERNPWHCHPNMFGSCFSNSSMSRSSEL
jgi:dGTP triphosphohydrolase